MADPERRAADVAVCVFAKPPRPGEAKTRLAATWGDEVAARLALAFLQDTWSAVLSLRWAVPILAVSRADEGLSAIAAGAEVWVQPPGDLGAKMTGIATRALASGFDRVLLIGADTPGLPLVRLEQAASLLRSHDAVLGPSDDGGFFLLGLRRCLPDMLHSLPWSQADTCARTEERLQALGLSVAWVEGWFDVDEARDLERLRELVAAGTVTCPVTTAVLQSLKTYG